MIHQRDAFRSQHFAEVGAKTWCGVVGNKGARQLASAAHAGVRARDAMMRTRH
jgi:hypothetical protein